MSVGSDLFFPGGAELTQLPMQDTQVLYAQAIALGDTPSRILNRLIEETPWRNESVVLWGKRHLQPRLIAWYGDPGARYKYSGISLDPSPWTELLKSVKHHVEAASGASFNSVLANYYRDNRDSMGFHSDDEPELGARPTIASVSLGEQHRGRIEKADVLIFQRDRDPVRRGVGGAKPSLRPALG